MDYLLSFVIVILDQASKIMALKYLKNIDGIPIVKNILHFTYVENRGAAFGILQNQKWIFIFITIAIIGFIIIYFKKDRYYPKTMMIGLSLIVGGAIGNLIDRIIYGYVVDFIDFRIWPVFNIADSAIVIGQVLVIYIVLRYDKLVQKGM